MAFRREPGFIDQARDGYVLQRSLPSTCVCDRKGEVQGSPGCTLNEPRARRPGRETAAVDLPHSIAGLILII